VGSVGATIAPYIGALLLLHEKDVSQSALDALNPAQLQEFLRSEAQLVKLPYLSLAVLFLAMGLLLFFIQLPRLKEEEQQNYSFKNVFKYTHAMLGVGAVFCYVGAEVGIVSFMIRYAKSMDLPGLTEQKSALFITVFMALVLFGRMAGSWILKKWKPSTMLVVSASGAFLLTLLAILTHGYFSLWSLAFIGLFTSIMYPILFTLSIKGLGAYTKTASSLLIMGIVCGAIVPPIMGQISDQIGIRISYVMPMLCYSYVFYFAVKGHVIKSKTSNS